MTSSAPSTAAMLENGCRREVMMGRLPVTGYPLPVARRPSPAPSSSLLAPRPSPRPRYPTLRSFPAVGPTILVADLPGPPARSPNERKGGVGPECPCDSGETPHRHDAA